jgi:hypothetical protein
VIDEVLRPSLQALLLFGLGQGSKDSFMIVLDALARRGNGRPEG